MSHLFQVGAGSGGIVVLDLLCRDERIDRVTIVEPDDFKQHNVVRHQFGPDAVGRPKADLAAEWLRALRPGLRVDVLPVNLLDEEHRSAIDQAAREADVGVCAVDNEKAKFRFDALMRSAGKPWTLGEVLSGGIGGWLHRFRPGGPCYGCVSTALRREIPTEENPPADYSDPNAVIEETTVPADKASITTIAGLHAMLTLELLDNPPADAPPLGAPVRGGSGAEADEGTDPGFTSLLMSLRKVPDVFEEPYRPHRFAIERNPDCLVCRPVKDAPSGEELDVALDQALARLDDE